MKKWTIRIIQMLPMNQFLIINMKTIKDFLSKCTAKLDVYNMDQCVSILTDSQGGEVARIDHINSKITCETSIWIGENERILTEKEIDYIIDYLMEQTKCELRDWNDNYNDNYDVREEQGLFGYGY